MERPPSRLAIIRSLRWAVLPVLSLGLGIALWALYATNLSLRGTIPDLVFPALVGVVGFATLLDGGRAPVRSWRLAARLLTLPATLGAFLFILAVMAFFAPPNTLGALLTLSEIIREQSVLRSISPGGEWVAEVRFRPTGPYAEGDGRTLVAVTYSRLPILEQDLYQLDTSFAGPDTTEWATWVDDKTIRIVETGEEVAVGAPAWRIPPVIDIPWNTGRSLLALREKDRRQRELCRPVEDLPLYGFVIEDDQCQYLEYPPGSATVFRSFKIPKGDLDKVVAWYQKALSKPPWSLVRVDGQTTEEAGIARVDTCIQARRENNNGGAIYYWEFQDREDGEYPVQVTIGTPHPITDICERYQDE